MRTEFPLNCEHNVRGPPEIAIRLTGIIRRFLKHQATLHMIVKLTAATKPAKTIGGAIGILVARQVFRLISPRHQKAKS